MSPNQLRFETYQYGGQDDTQPTSGANKRLNYWPDATPQNSRRHWVDKLPVKFSYTDSVGLPGVENYYLTYHLDRVAGWDQKALDYWNSLRQPGPPTSGTPYDNQRTVIVPDGAGPYEKHGPPPYKNPGFGQELLIHLVPNMVYVEVIDLKTGNDYNDDSFEVVLHRGNFQPVADNKGLFRHDEDFHVGFHSRNSRRCDFHVLVKVWPVVDETYFPTKAYVHAESLYQHDPWDWTLERDPEAQGIMDYIKDLKERGMLPPLARVAYEERT